MNGISNLTYPILLPTSYEEYDLYYEFKSKTYIKLKPSQAQQGLKDKSIMKADFANMERPMYISKAQNPKRRSRGGCLTCRQRKKRCCEQKPACYECTRLNIKCEWPIPGRERKNRNKVHELQHDEMYHEKYGVIKVLRGIVQYKIGDIDQHYREVREFEMRKQQLPQLPQLPQLSQLSQHIPPPLPQNSFINNTNNAVLR